MDGNIITSALGSQKLINFQQLMVVGGKGLVNNFLLRLCFFFFFADYLGQHNYMSISSFKSDWCLELSGYSLFLVCERYFHCGLEDVCYGVHETNNIWNSQKH
jgi:hypothetical protein